MMAIYLDAYMETASACLPVYYVCMTAGLLHLKYQILQSLITLDLRSFFVM